MVGSGGKRAEVSSAEGQSPLAHSPNGDPRNLTLAYGGGVWGGAFLILPTKNSFIRTMYVYLLPYSRGCCASPRLKWYNRHPAQGVPTSYDGHSVA